jgi:hypothetical protein
MAGEEKTIESPLPTSMHCEYNNSANEEASNGILGPQREEAFLPAGIATPRSKSAQEHSHTTAANQRMT